ncbi:MAG: threonine ammonia-lyase [Candidatus Hodarchaeales archaeon]|jgi:threonine dehydratase
MIPLTDFEDARKRILPYVDPSPIKKSNWLSKELDAEVYLKLECLQPGRSFKIRGATNALLSQKSLPKKVITASGGNHGLGVTIACNRVNVPCLVVLPTSTSKYRAQLLEDLGAEVLLRGAAWDESNDYALKLAEDPDILYIHPFADREVMLGQGTIALELVDQLSDFDTLIASVGGGGLLGGISLALEAMGKDVQIYSVETEGAESLAKSLEAQKLVELPAITSIAKTLGAKKTTPFIFETMQRLIDRYFVVTDADAVDSLVKFLDEEKILIEPATSCIVSVALQNPQLFRGKKVVFIICGSNVTLHEVEGWKKQFLET